MILPVTSLDSYGFYMQSVQYMWVRRCVYTRPSEVQTGLTKPLSTLLYVHLHSIITYCQIIIKFDPQNNKQIEAFFSRIIGPALVTVEGAAYYLLPFVSGSALDMAVIP